MTRRPASALLLPALLCMSLVGCGGSSGAAAQAAPTAAASGPPSAQVFALHGTDQDRFSPQRFSAKVGTLSLTLQNGVVPHNLVFDDASLQGIPTISGATTKTTVLTFTKPGTYQFVCTIHSGMDGAIVVH